MQIEGGGAPDPDAGRPGHRQLVVLTDGNRHEIVGAMSREYDDIAIIPLDGKQLDITELAETAVIVAKDLRLIAELLGRVAEAQSRARLAVIEQADVTALSAVLLRFDVREVTYIAGQAVVTLSPAAQHPGTAPQWVNWLSAVGPTASPALPETQPADTRPAHRAPATPGSRPSDALRMRGGTLVKWIRARQAHPAALAVYLGGAVAAVLVLLAVLAVLASPSLAAIALIGIVATLQLASLVLLMMVLVRSRRATLKMQASARRIDETLGRLRQDVNSATGVVATNALATREMLRLATTDHAFVVDDQARREEADGRERRFTERMTELSAHVSATADASAGRVDQQVTNKVAQRITQFHGSLLNDLQALDQLMARYQPTAPLPSVAGWAMNPTGLIWLVDYIERVTPSVVVECGSGTSTLWMTLALRRVGGGHLVALEHLPEFVEQTRLLLDRHGLSQWAEVRYVPLTTTDTPQGPFSWYGVQPATLSDIKLLLVDGPPGTTGPHARYPALPVLGRNLVTDATIVLDDSERTDEREIIDLWLAEDPKLRLDGRVAPGVDVLRRV